MRRWRNCLGAVAAAVLLAGAAAATTIDDRKRSGPTQAAADPAVDDSWDSRGVSRVDGGVDTAGPEIAGVEPTVVPEPTTLVLVSLGMVGLVFAGRRRV